MIASDSLANASVHTWAVLALTVLALILFTRKRIPLETSSLLVLVVISVGFAVLPFEVNGRALPVVAFYSGFGHEALVAVCALMIMGHGLVRTGALEPLGRKLAQSWSTSPKLSLLATLVAAAILSAFVNNTPVVVLLIPVLLSVAQRTKASTSGMLLPMGFATLVGGMSTSIGTSTNLLVVSVAADLGVGQFGMFDFAVPAMIAGGFGIAYLWLIAPHILPQRVPLMTDTSPRVFTAQLNIPADSYADGKTLSEVLKKLMVKWSSSAPAKQNTRLPCRYLMSCYRRVIVCR